MGCFNVPCGLSGLSISHGDPIIGFKVRLDGHKMNRNSHYEPTSLPVVGKYNDYGGLEGENGVSLPAGQGPIVLCHKGLWDYIAKSSRETMNEDWYFKDPIDMKTYFERVKENYLKMKSEFNPDTFTPQRVMHYAYAEGEGLHSMFFISSDFTALKNYVTARIIDGQYLTDQECTFLEEMAFIYMHSFISGRQVTDTMHCYLTQGADYKRIRKWLREVSKVSRKLKKG